MGRGVDIEKIPKGRSTKEFREEAIRLVIEDGLSLGDADNQCSGHVQRNGSAQAHPKSNDRHCLDSMDTKSDQGKIMKAVILAGGFGTRISEESYLKPETYD